MPSAVDWRLNDIREIREIRNDTTMRISVNALAERCKYTEEEARIVSYASAQRARQEISQWPGYAVTPLLRLSSLAAQMRVGALLYKDESGRLGRGSFKALGGAYAAMLSLRSYKGSGTATLCCATDGNHGLSVAYAARQYGCQCVVYVHEHAPEAKVAAIRGLGARVVRTAGTYDDSVQIAAQVAAKQGWLLIPDTTDNPVDETTRQVMRGYGVMSLELIEQFGSDGVPSHVFIQAGVGGLAAGVAGVLSEHYAEKRPTFVVVEPEAAACLLESNLCLRPAKVAGDLRTEMAMLSTGAASAAAWPILERRVDAFLAIDDGLALSARDRLTRPQHGDMSLDVGISGAAGIAGLMQVVASPKLCRLLSITTESSILVLGTESGGDETPNPAAGDRA